MIVSEVSHGGVLFLVLGRNDKSFVYIYVLLHEHLLLTVNPTNYVFRTNSALDFYVRKVAYIYMRFKSLF